LLKCIFHINCHRLKLFRLRAGCKRNHQIVSFYTALANVIDSIDHVGHFALLKKQWFILKISYWLSLNIANDLINCDEKLPNFVPPRSRIFSGQSTSLTTSYSGPYFTRSFVTSSFLKCPMKALVHHWPRWRTVMYLTWLTFHESDLIIFSPSHFHNSWQDMAEKTQSYHLPVVGT
jgi:hypothetical protein